MDIETDAIVPGGIKDSELKKMAEEGWVFYALEEDTELTVEFENPQKERYNRTGLVPANSVLVVNEDGLVLLEG